VTDNLTRPHLWLQFDVLIASRLVVGFGAGSMAVCNAYITGATTLEERTAWIGLLAGTGVSLLPSYPLTILHRLCPITKLDQVSTDRCLICIVCGLVQGLGFIVGPLIGSCFGKVPSVSASAGGG
jgi:hypothetical protein